MDNEIQSPQQIRTHVLWPLVGGGLGVSAFVADELTGTAGRIVYPFISSAFTWCLAALLTAYFAPSMKAAAARAAGCLALATTVYYFLILTVSRRWALGETEDGGSAAAAGLQSVLRASAFWFAASLCAGAFIGCIGYVMAHGSVRDRSLAAGLALGLLGAESWYNMLLGLAIYRMEFLQPADRRAQWFQFAPWPVIAVLAVLAVLLLMRGKRVSWLFAFAILGLMTVAWASVDGIRNLL